MASQFNDYLFMATFLAVSHAWDYEHQDKWPVVHCQQAVAQSPIDLRPHDMVKTEMPPFVFKNWDNVYDVSVKNNGHTIIITLPSNKHISFTGGGLPGMYELVQFHFHWGSEHTLNGERKALEAHFVGFNNKYKTQEEALKNENGLAVLGILYEMSDKNNAVLQPIIREIQNLKEVKKEVCVKLNPYSFFPRNVISFYRYIGSLTTPNCNDVVVWTVFKELCTVSEEQVNAFRSISNPEGGKLTENFRKLQPLNGRSVFKIRVD